MILVLLFFGSWLCLIRIVWYRYLLENMDWLEEELGDYDNDYLIFDCPGVSLD